MPEILNTSLFPGEFPSSLKAISLWQPWASLVAWESKRLETRSWGTDHRGPIAIHATKQVEFDLNENPHFAAAMIANGYRNYKGANEEQQKAIVGELMPYGSILAIADLVHCYKIRSRTIQEDGVMLHFHEHGENYRQPLQVRQISHQEAAFGDFSPGRYAWDLANVRPLADPIRCRGFQQIWNVPDDVYQQIQAQLSQIGGQHG